MQGQRLDRAEVTERGVLGDRAFALIDRSEGRVASAKYPKKWVGLLACSAAFVEPPSAGFPLPPVAIAFPDGSSTRSDASDVDDVLSRFVGREVTLASIPPRHASLEEWWPDIDGLAPAEHIQAGRINTGDHRDLVTQERLGLVSPPGTFFDCGPLHLITDATLTELGAHHADGAIDRKRFRPNIIVAGAGHGFVENNWIGHTLRIGTDVAVS
ncbi:MAG: MOSC domain-containing protein, partial [Candidatus Dormibacteria bacterium]